MIIDNLAGEDELTAIIPLRGGSKSIPKKNLKQFCGRPLCAWVIHAALNCPEIGRVIVSTDSDEIADAAITISDAIMIRKRPDQISGDFSTTEEAILDAVVSCGVNSRHVVTLQATSPQTTASDVSKAIHLLRTFNGDSLVTGTRVKRFFWSDEGIPLNYNPAARPMRQQWQGSIMENGAFYISRRDRLEAGESRLHGKVVVFEMADWASIELDESEDWAVLERIFMEYAQHDH